MGDAMTVNDAVARAAKVWGLERIRVVRAREDGGWNVETSIAGIASDTRDRNYCAHQLDASGHAVCHADCASIHFRPMHVCGGGPHAGEGPCPACDEVPR